MAGIDKTLSSRLLATMMPSLRGRARKAYLGESLQLLHGAQEGSKQGVKEAKLYMRKIRRGETVSDIDSKFVRDFGSSARAWARWEGSDPLAKGIRKVAPLITFPRDALAASDIFYKNLAAQAHLQALAFRRAKNEGIPMAETMANPPQALIDESMEFGMMATFSDRTGPLTAGIIHLRDQIPLGAGKAILPFVTTLTNIFKRGIEFTPGVGLALNRESAKALDLTLLARQFEGAVMTFLFLSVFGEDEITMGAPDNPVERADFYNQGKIPWSVKMPAHIPSIGGSWVSYRNAEPFNTSLTITASLRQMMDSATTESDSDVAGAFLAASQGMVDNLIESTYTENIKRALFPSGRFDPVTGAIRTAKRVPPNLMLYSNFWRSLNRGLEAGVWPLEDPTGAPLREEIDMLSMLANVIPFNATFWSQLDTGVPRGEIKVDGFGEEIILPGGMWRQWLPLRWNTPDLDPVEERMAEAEWMPGLPSRSFTIDGQEVTMEGEEYWTYAAAYGAATKKAIKGFALSATWQKLGQTEAGKERRLARLSSITSRTHRRLRKQAIRELKSRQTP
jgi:hypothetical protein